MTCSRHQSLQIFEFQCSKSLFLFIEGGQEIKTKIWRIGIRIFGDSDVVNKLQAAKKILLKVKTITNS